MPGRVINQLPEGNTLQSADTQIELWVSPEIDGGAYSKDEAFNLEIPVNDSKVRPFAILRVYYVLYENILPLGQQTVSLTVRGNTEGPYEIIVTVNGEEVRRESVTLMKRG